MNPSFLLVSRLDKPDLLASCMPLLVRGVFSMVKKFWCYVLLLASVRVSSVLFSGSFSQQAYMASVLRQPILRLYFSFPYYLLASISPFPYSKSTIVILSWAAICSKFWGIYSHRLTMSTGLLGLLLSVGAFELLWIDLRATSRKSFSRPDIALQSIFSHLTLALCTSSCMIFFHSLTHLSHLTLSATCLLSSWASMSSLDLPSILLKISSMELPITQCRQAKRSTRLKSALSNRQSFLADLTLLMLLRLFTLFEKLLLTEPVMEAVDFLRLIRRLVSGLLSSSIIDMKLRLNLTALGCPLATFRQNVFTNLMYSSNSGWAIIRIISNIIPKARVLAGIITNVNANEFCCFASQQIIQVI